MCGDDDVEWMSEMSLLLYTKGKVSLREMTREKRVKQKRKKLYNLQGPYANYETTTGKKQNTKK